MPGDREPAPQAWWARPESTTGPADAPPYAAHPAANWSRDSAGGTARTVTPATAAARRGVPTHQYRGRPPIFGDQRGLTAAGASAIVLILAALSAGVDVATGSGLRTVFTVTFVIAAALSAATVHNEDLFASVVLVPLAYAAVAGIAGLADGSGAGTLNTIGSIASTMINAAPSLMMATVATAVIAGARAYANRRASRSGRSDRAGLTGRAHA